MMSWYILSMGTDPTTKFNYEKIYAQPTCYGKDSICAIRAFDDGHNYPLISEQLKFEMISALWNNIETPNVRLHYSWNEQQSVSIVCENYLFNELPQHHQLTLHHELTLHQPKINDEVVSEV